MKESELLGTLKNWDSMLCNSNVFFDIFIQLGWGLTWLLKSLVDACEGLLNEAYKLLDFTSYAGLYKILNQNELKIVLGILLAGALMFLGYTLIMNHDEKKPKVAQNLLILVIAICALPTFMAKMNHIVIEGRSAIQGGEDKVSISDTVISNAITDLAYIDEQGLNNYSVKNGNVSGGPKSNYTKKNAHNVSYIDPTETISKGSDMFSYKLVTDKNGDIVVEKMKEKSFMFVFKSTEWYYRYKIDFLSIFISLTATGLALFFTAYKVARIAWELAIHQFLAAIFAASDLTSGQRVKQVLKSIMSMYTVLLLTTVFMKFFLLMQEYINQKITNSFSASLLLIPIAAALIDGPNIIERVLGIDAGISSGFKTMASIMMGAKAAGRGAKALTSIAGKTGKGISAAKRFVGKGDQSSDKGSSNLGSGINPTNERSDALNNPMNDIKSQNSVSENVSNSSNSSNSSSGSNNNSQNNQNNSSNASNDSSINSNSSQDSSIGGINNADSNSNINSSDIQSASDSSSALQQDSHSNSTSTANSNSASPNANESGGSSAGVNASPGPVQTNSRTNSNNTSNTKTTGERGNAKDSPRPNKPNSDGKKPIDNKKPNISDRRGNLTETKPDKPSIKDKSMLNTDNRIGNKDKNDIKQNNISKASNLRSATSKKASTANQNISPKKSESGSGKASSGKSNSGKHSVISDELTKYVTPPQEKSSSAQAAERKVGLIDDKDK